MTLFDPGLCHWCDRPQDEHPVYRALLGVHDWEPAIDPPTAAPVAVELPADSGSPPETTSKSTMLQRLRAAMGT